jgi:hypothetical protein
MSWSADVSMPSLLCSPRRPASSRASPSPSPPAWLTSSSPRPSTWCAACPALPNPPWSRAPAIPDSSAADSAFPARVQMHGRAAHMTRTHKAAERHWPIAFAPTGAGVFASVTIASPCAAAGRQRPVAQAAGGRAPPRCVHRSVLPCTLSTAATTCRRTTCSRCCTH